MANERLLADVLKDLHDEKKTGAIYVSVVETSEDLIRIYLDTGDIYHIRYGTAIGKDCLDILEYYNLWNATFFAGIRAPGELAKDLPDTERIIDLARKTNKTVKVK